MANKLRSKREKEAMLQAAALQQSLAEKCSLERRLATMHTKNNAQQNVTNEQWAEIHCKAKSAGRTVGTCAICRGGYGKFTQVLLSCGHSFHGTCLQSLERWANGRRVCPLCRTEDYQKVSISDGAQYARERSAISIQSAWRRYVCMRWFGKMKSSIVPQQQIPIGKFEDAIQQETKRLAASVDAAEQQVDCLLGEMEFQRQQLNNETDLLLSRALHERNYHHMYQALDAPTPHQPSESNCTSFEQYPASMCIFSHDESVDWPAIQEKALHRQQNECVICFSDLSASSGKGVALLSCSHRLHFECLQQFERFTAIFCNDRSCPVCRQAYVSMQE